MAYPVTLSFTFGGITNQAQLVNLDADLANIASALNGLGNGSSVLTRPVMGTANISVAFIGNLTLQNPLSPAMGGTGTAGPFTDGQLLIGSNTTSGLVASTIAGGAGITISNAPGAVTISAAAGNFMQMKNQVFTSSGTFTASANATHKFTVVGAGGGSGSLATFAGVVGASGGGGGGATALYWANLTTGSNVTVAVGLGGTGTASETLGTTGGNSAVIIGATTISAGGGTGGDGSAAVVGNLTTNGGSGGTATNGTINIAGGAGGKGFFSNLYASSISTAGFGGSSLFSEIVPGVSSGITIAGTDGLLYGAGASGSVTTVTASPGTKGANGAPGIVIVEWMQ